MARKHAFPPSVAADTRVLVLGSLPGDASLAAGQYYAHPANAFWAIIGAVIETPLTGLPYSDRLEALRGRGIGLWDVIAHAERAGSLDGAIRRPAARDLAGFVTALPALRAVAFNGGTAARIGRRALAGVTGIALLDLPSTSPAFAAMSRAEKQQRWEVLRDYLDVTPAQAEIW